MVLIIGREESSPTDAAPTVTPLAPAEAAEVMLARPPEVAMPELLGYQRETRRRATL
jgi:hypothetical protein